jgi:DHA2 family multidrug resistance protein
MSCTVMEILDTSVVNVSLPHIAGSLSATVEEATWVLTSYLVANAIMLPISGWTASRFGRRRLLLTVVTGFTVSSVLCGLAPSLGWLVFFRVMQGTTGGGLQPLSQAVLLETFPPEERGTAMAFWGLGIIAAPILGPTLGGWLTEEYSWRWVFYINLPVGIFSLLMIRRFVTDPPYFKRTSRPPDLWGLGALALGMGAFQIMLDKGQEEDWFASRFIIALACTAAVVLPLFVLRELRIGEPLVNFRLLRHRTFATGVFLATVLGFVLYGSIVLLPLYMQTLLGFPALTAGLWSSPRGLGTLAVMPLTGFLLKRRWDPRLLLVCGLLAVSASSLGYAHLNLQAGTADLIWPQVLQGMGLAMVFVPLTTVAMDPIPLASMGYATSIFSMMRNVGASLGISAVTTGLARRAQFHQARLAEQITPGNPAVRQALQALTDAFRRTGSDTFTASHRALAVLYAQVLRQAAALSFLDAFRALGILFLLASPLVWIMKRPRQGPVPGAQPGR